jgi:hypothetical protein
MMSYAQYVKGKRSLFLLDLYSLLFLYTGNKSTFWFDYFTNKDMTVSRNPLHQNKQVIFCQCGMRIDTEVCVCE